MFVTISSILAGEKIFLASLFSFIHTYSKKAATVWFQVISFLHFLTHGFIFCPRERLRNSTAWQSSVSLYFCIWNHAASEVVQFERISHCKMVSCKLKRLNVNSLVLKVFSAVKLIFLSFSIEVFSGKFIATARTRAKFVSTTTTNGGKLRTRKISFQGCVSNRKILSTSRRCSRLCEAKSVYFHFQHRGPEKPVYKEKPKFNTEDEPLLRENPHRFVLLPIQYKDIWLMYKKAEGKRSKWLMKFINFLQWTFKRS